MSQVPNITEVRSASAYLCRHGMGNGPRRNKQGNDMTKLNNETINDELSIDALDVVAGGGPVVDLMHYAQMVGVLTAIYSQPAVETAGCTK
jgi:hypothetical protein